MVGVGCGSVVGVADLEITLILGRVGRRAQACSLVVLVTAAEGHAGVRVLAVSVLGQTATRERPSGGWGGTANGVEKSNHTCIRVGPAANS